MQTVMQWVSSIVFFLIFMSLLMQVIPGEKYQKYVRFFAGMLLVLLVITPMIRWFKGEKRLQLSYLEKNFEQAAEEAAGEVQQFQDTQKKEIGNEYEQQIRQALDRLAASYSYKLYDASVVLEDQENSEQYLYPRKIFLQIQPLGTDSQEKIQVDEIEIGSQKDQVNSQDTDTIEALKQEIAQFFAMKEEAIEIEVVDR